MKKILLLYLLFTGILFYSCKQDTAPVKIRFENGKEVSGRKISIDQLSTGIPDNWNNYNYLMITLRSSTSQRIYIGINTHQGYNESGITFYLTDSWVQCALPLACFREKPSGQYDLISTYNRRRKLSRINFESGIRTPLEGVDSIGFRMFAPIGDQQLEIKSIALTKDDPDDLYLEEVPAIDKFGQWIPGDFEGKIKNVTQLITEWNKEEEELRNSIPYGRNSSIHGDIGYGKTGATGFFRTEKINGTWWFIDPQGYPFLSLGVHNIRASAGNIYNIIPGVYTIDPPEGFRLPKDSPYNQGVPISFWNLYRRYKGDISHALIKNNELNNARMDHWGVNTIGHWPDTGLIALNQKPFIVTINHIGNENGIWGLPDIYTNDFEAICRVSIRKQIEKHKDNPMLLGYFLGNSPAWINHEEEVCNDILNMAGNRSIKKALSAYLMEEDSPKRRKQFVYNVFRRHTEIVATEIRKIDNNHLIFGTRFNDIVRDDSLWMICKEYYDICSINCNKNEPPQEYIEWLGTITGLPVYISEFRFGSVDRGFGGTPVLVANQAERGMAFGHYAEKAFSYPSVIGICYSQWMDDPLLGRGDGENSNTGLIDITNRPYPDMVKAIKNISGKMYRIHAGF